MSKYDEWYLYQEKINSLLAKRKNSVNKDMTKDITRTQFNRLRMLVTQLLLDIEKDFTSTYIIDKEGWM